MNSAIEAARTRNEGQRRSRTSNTSGGTQQGSGSDPSRGTPPDDRVIQLRQLGSDRRFPLPTPRGHEEGGGRRAREGGDLLLGSSEQCHLRVVDPKRRVSRQHARVFYRDGSWRMLDLGSKNGIYVDGFRQQAVQLVPGMLIRIGSVTLLVESRRLLELRGVLSRLLGWGWGDDREAAVEKALQDVRTCRAQREPLWLHSEGEGDLTAIAQELHRAMSPPSAPFVMCDARRQSGRSDVRSPANEDELGKAVAAAQGGTLCVRSNRLPPGFTAFVQRLRAQPYDPKVAVQVMILCEDVVLTLAQLTQATITIPPLRSREHGQREHVVREYLLDARAALGFSGPLASSDLAWILEHSASTFSEVAKGASRITALRMSRSVVEAAALLDMAPVSLRRWIGRRGVPSFLAETLSVNDGDDDEQGALE